MHKPSARVLVFSTMLVGLIGLVWFLRSSKASQLQQTKTDIAAERREEPQQETADVVLTQQNDTNIPYDIHGSIAASPIMISSSLAAVATPQADGSEADQNAELRQSSAFTNQPVAEIELELVSIAPGSFVMGSPENEQGRRSNEGPQTQVTITQGFWMGKYEVTFSQYESVMGEIKPWRYLTPKEECANRAVHGIRWKGAMQFCERLSQQELASGRLPDGYIYRLPTEAEWEYACRAGTTTRFSFGDDESLADSYVWYAGTAHGKPQDVGTKQPNPWGLYDMHGGVGEMCLDYLTYSGGSVTNPVGSLGDFCMSRGGSWAYVDLAMCRSAVRIFLAKGKSCVDDGFRVVLAPLPPGSVNRD